MQDYVFNTRIYFIPSGIKLAKIASFKFVIFKYCLTWSRLFLEKCLFFYLEDYPIFN